MAKNWALVIGINQYDFLQPLNYAKQDAQLMQEFLGSEAGFERIFFFSDDSPDFNGKSTRPNRSNLRQVLLGLFEQTDPPKMGAGDNFWFFFSGHGMRHNDRDYLMPCDGNSRDIEHTAIPINFVTERLRRCGADNVVLILDACRSQGTRAGEGIGRQTEDMARTTGVISIFSCSPNEYSYEIDALEQGAFTHVLLEGLGIQGKCATVERLNQYLSLRVPEVVRKQKNARQTPYIIAEPINKSHLILVPKYATLTDIATLKNDAYQAEVNKQFELAEQLWIRVLAAASGQDIEAINGLQRIAQIRYSQNTLPPSTFAKVSSTLEKGDKSKSPTPPSTIQPQKFPSPQIDDLSSDRNRIKLVSAATITVGLIAGGPYYYLTHSGTRMAQPAKQPLSSPSQPESALATPTAKPTNPTDEIDEARLTIYDRLYAPVYQFELYPKAIPKNSPYPFELYPKAIPTTETPTKTKYDLNDPNSWK